MPEAPFRLRHNEGQVLWHASRLLPTGKRGSRKAIVVTPIYGCHQHTAVTRPLRPRLDATTLPFRPLDRQYHAGGYAPSNLTLTGLSPPRLRRCCPVFSSCHDWDLGGVVGGWIPDGSFVEQQEP